MATGRKLWLRQYVDGNGGNITARLTPEFRLHLEIYKQVPKAHAVIHCHPPYATAYAVAQLSPQGNLVPEQEVFIGPVPVAPYETPGTHRASPSSIVPLSSRLGKSAAAA